MRSYKHWFGYVECAKSIVYDHTLGIKNCGILHNQTPFYKPYPNIYLVAKSWLSCDIKSWCLVKHTKVVMFFVLLSEAILTFVLLE